jgi:uncharacterized coiled-coil protein SlyX
LYGDEQDHGVGLYLERESGSTRALLVVLRDGWQPHVIDGLSVDENGPGEVAPVFAAGPGGSIRFTGSADSDGGMSGKVQDVTSGRKGSWELVPVQGANQPAENVGEEVRLSLLLKGELSDTEYRIAEAQREVPEQRAEIDRLNEFVTEGEKLRARADEKLRALSDELGKTRQLLKVKQTEAERLSDQFDLAQRVSGMGRLVTLSRDSLDRETHWFNSVLRSEPQQSSSDLEQAVERGQKILALKREIMAERERIAALQHPAAEAGAPPPTAPASPPEASPTKEDKSLLRRILPW